MTFSRLLVFSSTLNRVFLIPLHESFDTITDSFSPKFSTTMITCDGIMTQFNFKFPYPDSWIPLSLETFFKDIHNTYCSCEHICFLRHNYWSTNTVRTCMLPEVHMPNYVVFTFFYSFIPTDPCLNIRLIFYIFVFLKNSNLQVGQVVCRHAQPNTT